MLEEALTAEISTIVLQTSDFKGSTLMSQSQARYLLWKNSLEGGVQLAV